ncbi:uncharacterized protein SPSK_07598 [Sporothrix schenckii 1099-18]|uniref:Uncharacterized protein n=1 Tax=Sporothrix schenckii 1099-18 TaxID=1397361 RepID=A0A0F2MHY0_SPOSC|nr:uncharacterized protein SPSK_07598 [Sporothrix schenckii 1099-18]KJR88664.1 hypothetical protein SPSK_07598 [Sporothrix schenckii 1099-18]
MAPNPRTAALNAAPGLAAAPSSTMPPNPEPADETTSQRILKNLFYLLSFPIPNHRLDFTNREIERGEWLRRLSEVQKEMFVSEHILTNYQLTWARRVLFMVFREARLSRTANIYCYMLMYFTQVPLGDDVITFEPGCHQIASLEAEKAFIEVVPALAQSTVYCCTPMTFEKQAQIIIDSAKESGVIFQNHIAYINDMLVAQAIKYISDRNGYFKAHSCRLGEYCRNKRACNGGPKFPFLPEALVTEPEQTVPANESDYHRLRNSYPGRSTTDDIYREICYRMRKLRIKTMYAVHRHVYTDPKTAAPWRAISKPIQPSTLTVHSGITGPQTGAVASQARHTQAPPLDIQTPRASNPKGVVQTKNWGQGAVNTGEATAPSGSGSRQTRRQDSIGHECFTSSNWRKRAVDPSALKSSTVQPLRNL